MLVAKITGHRILLPENGELTLGRFDPLTEVKPDVDLTFEDRWARGISRSHARISGWQGQYEITDLGSSNGTWVNGKRLPLEKNPQLRVGDEVRLGSCVLYFDLVPELCREPPPACQSFLYVTSTGHYIPLPMQDVITIGRSDPALAYRPDIDLSDEGDVASVVSRHHAKLIRKGNQLLVEDLGSVHKTQIDAQPVYVGLQVPIKPGQHLWLGGCVLAFDVLEAPGTGR